MDILGLARVKRPLQAMCDADSDQILDYILLCFEVILGLKVNLGKSELVTVRELTHQEELADLFGYSFLCP